MNFLRNSVLKRKSGGSKRNVASTRSGATSPREASNSVSSEASLGADTFEKLETFNLDIDKLLMGAELGRGNFSVVRKAMLGDTVVAVKKQKLTDPDLERYLRKELAVLKLISHPGLVRYVGAGKRDDNVYIVTEYLPGGDLRRLLVSGEPLGWRLRVRLIQGVASALAYLHTRDIIHRDVKTENILLDCDFNTKLCDFGFARKNDPGKTMTMCGTDEFMAPEVLFGMPYDEKADMFSLGIVMAEMIVRKSPGKRTGFLDRQPKDGFAVDFDKLNFAYTESSAQDLPTSLQLLGDECMKTEASERPSATDANEWLQELYGDLPPDTTKLPDLSEANVLATAKKRKESMVSNASMESTGDLLEEDSAQAGRVGLALQRTSMAVSKMREQEINALRASIAIHDGSGLDGLAITRKAAHVDKSQLQLSSQKRKDIESTIRKLELKQVEQHRQLLKLQQQNRPGLDRIESEGAEEAIHAIQTTTSKPTRPGAAAASSSNMKSSASMKGVKGGRKKKPPPPTVNAADTFKEGYVVKRGGRFKSWKRRYVLVTDLGLVYFKSRADYERGTTVPQGAVLFENMMEVRGRVATPVPTVVVGKPFGFKVHTHSRDYFISAETESDRHEWMTKLQRGFQQFELLRVV